MSYKSKILNWNFCSLIILASFGLLQIIRWPILPQFIDSYYHLLTSWAFLKAGGYSGWDFWEYAPVGRIHIYPPLLHILWALLIKLGINKIILIKLFEAIMPALFLVTVWYFIKRNFTRRLAFFTLLTILSSFSFYLSLFNNLPAALGLILGIASIDRLLRRKVFQAGLLLVACLYTHIGVSWLFMITMALLGIFNKEQRKQAFLICLLSLIACFPLLFKQIQAAHFISLSGISEKYFCEFKTIEYILAAIGLWLAIKNLKLYNVFVSLFVASFIFIFYPYRFFSAQGYLPIALLSALSIDAGYQQLKEKGKGIKYLLLAIIFYFLILSPTIAFRNNLLLFDSSLVNTLLPNMNRHIISESLWLPDDYLPASHIIRSNSEENDIIYSNYHITGVALASISGRPTANALLAEIKPTKGFDPLASSKIIIFTKSDNQGIINTVTGKYGLLKIGETKLFLFYKNPSCSTKVQFQKATVAFWLIYCLLLLIITVIFIKTWKKKTLK